MTNNRSDLVAALAPADKAAVEYQEEELNQYLASIGRLPPVFTTPFFAPYREVDNFARYATRGVK